MASASGRAIRSGSRSRQPESWRRAAASYAPRSAAAADSVALEIARRCLRPDAVVHELTFPMTADAAVLRRDLAGGGPAGAQTLSAGEDCCFLTLGDPLLYSTYIYLLRELRALDPAVDDRHRAGRDGA